MMYPNAIVVRSSLFPCQHVVTVLARYEISTTLDDDGVHIDPSEATEIDKVNLDNGLGLPSIKGILVGWQLDHGLR